MLLLSGCRSACKRITLVEEEKRIAEEKRRADAAERARLAAEAAAELLERNKAELKKSMERVAEVEAVWLKKDIEKLEEAAKGVNAKGVEAKKAEMAARNAEESRREPLTGSLRHG